MSNEERVWVDSAIWRENWDSIESLRGGGQGNVSRARRRWDGKHAFMKVIRTSTDAERRARFFREATAYNTFRVDGIPSLIESNAQHHQDSSVTPYVATDFIDGPNLRDWRENRSDVNLQTAVTTTRALIRIIRECHAEGVVHRDIKPDNIILANGDPARPVLLDFGLSFGQSEETSLYTEQGQEIGNRFLRLPELSSGSQLKQDARSDLSFAAGILFFLLTGKNPDVLQDAEGRLPHQRGQVLQTLRSVAGPHQVRLASLLDRGFSSHIDDRFLNADAFLRDIDSMMKPVGKKRASEDSLKAILDIIDTSSSRRRAQATRISAEALRQVQEVYREVQKSLNSILGTVQSNYRAAGNRAMCTLSWRSLDSDVPLGTAAWEAEVVGDELVIRMADEAVFRTAIDSPEFGTDFRETIKEAVLRRLNEALNNPDPLPPEAEHFREITPFGTLDAASQAARKAGKYIFAFVYDPSQLGRGRLNHGLLYFLQNRKTRDALHTTFVVALVPLSEVAARTDLLENESMESSRWVILDTNLEPIRQKVIHANPQDAERLALELAEEFVRN